MSSEVTKIRQRIEAEITAMNLLMSGPAMVGRHEIIAHKYHSLMTYREQLGELVGEEQAGATFFDIYFHAVEGDQHANAE